ncbi:hypothetical protein JD844_006145 [Phrynosoma platyrhinos]|uniref:IRG-type G domain-containing protein n=1 Tax=Phrynosoma platyrhinos TaxID=52577 RepID=A0ABQ7TSB4_PHRPL|nr:hypothetical protein JD844_006145 [Phrynosoma platyrhinos]
MPEPVHRAHPAFPQLTLHDLPGFAAGESPMAYLGRLGDLGRYGCLVVVVGAEGPPGLEETLWEVLRAVRQKARSLLLVRTKVDLDLHTAKRRLLSQYDPGEQLALIRKELAETLAKERVDPKQTFLLSGLETERYDFACLEESLEKEVLGLTRKHEVSPVGLAPVSHRKVKELYEICRSSSLLEALSIIHAALEDPTDIRLDVAVVGEAGCDKSFVINALQEVSCGEPGTALAGVAQTPRKAGPYQLATVPQSYLWDLAGWGAVGEDIWPLGLGRYDLFLLMAPDQCKDAPTHLARAITSEGKEIFLIRSKMEARAQTGPQQELQEGGQASGLAAPQEDNTGCSSRVFLVPYDLPILQKALQSGAPGWKKQALRRAIPMVVSHLVRQKARELMKDAWGKALHACLSCLESSQATAVENLLATIAGFRLELGLDEDSLERITRVVGKAASVLQAETRSLFARPMAPNTLLGLITKPPSLGSWAWSYVPYFGWGAKTETQVSFAATYGTLQRAVVELSEDAERVLCRALVED